MPVALLTLPAVSPTGFAARSGLWRIFRIALHDSRFASHFSRIVTCAQVQRWRHSPTGVFSCQNLPGQMSIIWWVFWSLSRCLLLLHRLANGKGAKRVSYFGNEHSFLLNDSFDANQICYGAWGRWIVLKFCSSSGSASYKGLWTICSRIRHLSKNLTVSN